MKKVILSLLTLASALGAQAAVGDLTAWVFRGEAFTGDWNVNEAYRLREGENNTIYIEFPGGKKFEAGKQFAIDQVGNDWKDKTKMIVMGADMQPTQLQANTAYPVFHGGDRNGVAPAATVYKITVTLPSNTTDLATASYVPGTGAGSIYFDTTNPLGEPVDPVEGTWYLRGEEFWSGNGRWYEATNGYPNIDGRFGFKKDDGSDVYYIDFASPISFTGREFVIAQYFQGNWDNNRCLVFGSMKESNLNANQTYENELFYGGSRNGHTTSGVAVRRIEFTLPSTATQASGDSYPSSGGGSIRFITDDKVTVDVKSEYGLQVWLMPQGETTMDPAWDYSGGLARPLWDDSDEHAAFKNRYMREENADTRYMMFARVNVDGDDPSRRREILPGYESAVKDENGIVISADPFEGYDMKKHIVQYYEGSKIYVIDFTVSYPDGLEVKVPSALQMADSKTEGKESFNSVPYILRSGVRFGLRIFDEQNHNKDEYKGDANERWTWLKYGRAMRLNEFPADISAGSSDYWNGFPWKNSDWANASIQADVNKGDADKYNGSDDDHTHKGASYYNKMGDNRLLSEYNMFINRIILEVVNEGDKDNEKVYIRFEGRYELQSLVDSNPTYAYDLTEAGKDVTAQSNHTSDAPNIYVGSRFQWYDRGFTRFYDNFTPSLHGPDYTTMEEVNELRAKYGLPDFSEPYITRTSYGVVNKNGESVRYADLVDGKVVEIKQSTRDIEYVSTGSEDFLVTKYDGEAVTDGRTLSTTRANLAIESDKDTYGNATELTVQVQDKKLIYNWDASNENNPAKIFSNVTYVFPHAEPNNVPTYTFEDEVRDNNDFSFQPAVETHDLKRDLRGAPAGQANYLARLSLAGTTYASGKEYQMENDGTWDLVDHNYPVTRWEFRSKVLEGAGDNGEGADHSAYPFASFESDGAYDAGNSLRVHPGSHSTVYGAWPGELYVQYCADMYYTLGNIVNAPGSNKIIVTRVALERYVEEDARGIALMAADTETPAPAYSVKGAGTEPVKLVLGSDVAADGIPDEYKSIQVQLAEQGKHAHTIAHFESDMLTGVEDVAAEAVRIAVAGRTVLISGTEAPAVVADMAGAVVYSGTSRSIGLQPGIYVVCVDGRTAKVMVR